MYVADLQLQSKAPTLGHVWRAKRIEIMIRLIPNRLGLWVWRLTGQLRLVNISGSASQVRE